MIFDRTEYNALITDILQGRINATVNVASFGGPSMYFHHRAVELCKSDFLSEGHIEMVYATLVAWGMHRTGKGGSKMPNFKDFSNSIKSVSSTLYKYQHTKIENVSANDIAQVIAELSDICFGVNSIKASTTKSKFVSASKTLAHILPDLVPPMDRQYTIKFFNKRKANYNLTIKDEKQFFEAVLHCMWEFYQNHNILNNLRPLIQNGSCSSLPKLFDDLIIATF